MTLEAKLEQSKDEAATLKDQIDECERTRAARDELAAKLESEQRTSAEFREALTRSEGRESELTAGLEEAELERLDAEQSRREEVRELQYYRTLESERKKWEAREQRALDEIDRLRGDCGGVKGVDYTALSEKLEEAYQQQQCLQTMISEGESVNSNLKGELEECRSENEELRAELELLRIKVRRLERSTEMPEGSEKDDPATSQPSSQLDASAPVFTPTVRSSLPEETTPQASTETRRLTTTTSSSTTLPCLLERSGQTLPAETTVSFASTTVMATSIATYTPTTTTVPATSGTGAQVPVSMNKGVGPVVGATSAPLLATSTISPIVPSTTPNPMTIVSTSPSGIAGTAFPYPAVHPNHLPQIPNFHGGDQRDGETFDDWLDHFEAVASIARWDPSFKLVHLAAALRGNAKSFYRSCTPTQKSSYPQLVSALKIRFTPKVHSSEADCTSDTENRELQSLSTTSPKSCVNYTRKPTPRQWVEIQKLRKWARLCWSTSLYLAFGRNYKPKW